MSCYKIDAPMISRMFLAGAQNLEAKKEWINELNVFPVPDGDTGTNMTLTILSAAQAVRELGEPDMLSLSKAMSGGSLRGARGNSGVILSQLLRGFSRVVQDYEQVDRRILAESFRRGVETAYKAVMKPKEGTILTVARSVADKAEELVENDPNEDLQVFFKDIFDYAEETLRKTPEMLPVLKEAGVVDSGGQGLVEVLRGALDAFYGKPLDFSSIGMEGSATTYRQNYQAKIAEKAVAADGAKQAVAKEADIKFGYCTEFIIMTETPVPAEEAEKFREYLGTIGDSIVFVPDDELIKVHVHTNEPGNAIQKALTYGELSNLKIDNMRMEHRERLFAAQEVALAQEKEKEEEMPHKEMGFVVVSAGEGLDEIFRELGADRIIEGGQTMNPSTEDILNAINRVNADTIFLLPNNKNIILAANQAAALSEDKKVIVIPTRTIPQGITAIINFVPDLSAEENEASLLMEIDHVKTGQVTYAVRDTSIDGKEIRQGDYMGIGDHGLIAVGTDRRKAAEQLIDALVEDSIELISIYYGKEVTEEEAEALKDHVLKKYKRCDVELQYGGQPVYFYLISAE